jgi:hypothetical protein
MRRCHRTVLCALTTSNGLCSTNAGYGVRAGRRRHSLREGASGMGSLGCPSRPIYRPRDRGQARTEREIGCSRYLPTRGLETRPCARSARPTAAERKFKPPKLTPASSRRAPARRRHGEPRDCPTGARSSLLVLAPALAGLPPAPRTYSRRRRADEGDVMASA